MNSRLCETLSGRVDLALVVECLYLNARMLPIGLCDSTLTTMVPLGAHMVADKHNWSLDSTTGRLDCSLVAWIAVWSPLLCNWSLGTPFGMLCDRWFLPGMQYGRLPPVWSPTLTPFLLLVLPLPFLVLNWSWKAVYGRLP